MSNNQMMKFTEAEEPMHYKGVSTSEMTKPAIVHTLDYELLEILKKKGPLTRSRLVSITGKPRSTLYDSLKRLIVKRYVISYSEDRRKRGRPKTYFKVL